MYFYSMQHLKPYIKKGYNTDNCLTLVLHSVSENCADCSGASWKKTMGEDQGEDQPPALSLDCAPQAIRPHLNGETTKIQV